jgi:outer membrane usher protein
MIWLLLFFLAPGSAVAAKPSLAAPILLGSETLGESWLYLGPAPSLQTSALLEALEPVLNREARAELTAGLRGKETVSFAELELYGLGLRFDEAALVVHLTLPDQLRKRKDLRIRPENAEKSSVGPAAFSGYLNTTVSQGFSYPASRSRAPFRGNLGLVSNYRGFVLESGSTFAEKQPHEWARDDTRLTRDFEAQALRVSVGDVPVLGSGYQNSRTLGGISVTRQYSIQPYLNIRPLNRTELLVKLPSTIEVYVNDGFVNRVNASPGPVQLSDFPLFSGVNKVDLKVTDDTGAVEWINLNMLYDTQLLGDGIQQFAYHFGAPSEAFQGDRRYDDRNLTASFFHRAGLSDRFTVGLSFQSDKSSWLAGSEFVFLTRGGLFSGESGYSYRSNSRDGAAGRIRFRSLDYKLGADKPVRGAAEVEYKSPYFAAIGQSGLVNDFSWKYDLSLSKPLTAVASTALTLQYLVNRLNKSDRKSARLDFTSEIARDWRTSLSYTAEREDRLAHRFQIVLTWLESEGKLYGNLSYDYPSKTVRLEANRSPSAYVGDVRATLGVQNSPSAAQGDALVEYTHEKANLRFEQVSAYRREAGGDRNLRHTSTFTAATALAWAGGAVGWTRPINDSFAIIKARDGYDFPIPVNRVEESAEATVNKIGPGVVPTLTSYNETPIILDPSNLPIGYSIKEYQLARPTYRSGLRIDLGGDAKVTVSGILLRPDGKPLELAIGEARSAGKTIDSFFTNRAGIFLIENLAPGEYELFAGDYPPVKIRVSESQAGLVRLGKIQLKGNP